MWVSTLEINGIKSIEQSGIINLDKRMNILLGANNAGKSTILRVLYLMQNSTALSHSDVRIGSDARCAIRLEEIHSNEIMTNMRNSGFPPIIHIEGSRKYDNLLVYMFNANNSQKPNIRIPSREPENFIYPYLSKRKVGAYRREVHRLYAVEVADTLVDIVPKVDRLANQYYTRHKEFEQACIDILGFPITTFPAADNNGKQVGIVVNDYDCIPLEAMGEGVPNLLGLIVNLCMAEHKLFLIEELENDIHPQALKKLLELIAKKAEVNQFVISTHSNIVAKYLGSIPGSKMHYVSLNTYNPDGRIPTTMYKEVGTSSQERRKVLEDLGYDLVDYDLAKAWIFFEESSAERIIRELLIPRFASRLVGCIRTIAAQGNRDVEPKFNDFNRLFLFLHLESIYKNHAWVIIDGDSASQIIIEDLKTKYASSGWTEDKFICLSKHDFEEYYPNRFHEKVVAVLGIQNKQAKRDAKKQLLEEVLNWIASDPEQAKTEFEISALEVIKILKQIEANV